MKKIISFLILCSLLIVFIIGNKTVNAEETFTVETFNGASMRLNDPNGLRFKGIVNGKILGTNVSYGIAIANGIVDASDITVNKENVVNAEVDELNEDGSYSVSMVGIPTRAFTSSMTARAYIIVDGRYYYSDNAVSRNIYEVAYAAKNSNPSNEYINYVLDNCYNITYYTNGGNFKYQNHDELVADFMNDLKLFSGEDILLTNIYEKRITIQSFYSDDEMLAKWGWIVQLFYDLGVQGVAYHTEAQAQYEAYLAGNAGTAKTWAVAHNLEGFLTLTKATGYSIYIAIDFSDSSISSLIEGAVDNGQKTVVLGKDASLETTIYKTGYEFAGWYAEAECINRVDKATYSGSLYAKWQIPSYDINYVLNEGVLPDDIKNSYTKGETYTLPIPSRVGHIFDGWYLDSEFTERITEITASFDYDLTIYAKWIPSTITYVLNDGMWKDEEIIKAGLTTYNSIGTGTITKYIGDYFSEYTNNIFIAPKGSMENPIYSTRVGLKDLGGIYQVVQVIDNGTSSSYLDSVDYAIYWNKALDSVMPSSFAIGSIIVFDQDLAELTTGDINLNMTVYNENDYNVVITQDTILIIEFPYTLSTNIYKQGHTLAGWYLSADFTGEPVTEIDSYTTVYAKWTEVNSGITTANILDCVSDIVASNTKDTLILENTDATFIWSSSNNNLYKIDGNIGSTSKIYQTHKTQTVTVSVKINYKNGTSITESKEIIIDPVLYSEMPTTPVATYFATSSISTYQKYNERYKTDGSYFSEDTKETLNLIYYAFIMPKADGTVSFQNASYIEEVKKLKANDVRVLASIHGVSSETCQAFKTITADANLRKTFINNLMDLVEKYNLDGLDIDWETVDSTLKPVASQLNLFVQELRAEMNLRQAERGTPYLITIAIPASTWGTATDRFDMPTLNEYLDYVNIMSYDLHKTDTTTHVSPLYSSSNDGGWGFGCAWAVDRFVTLGIDKNKLIIGCAGYGKAFKISGNISSATYPGLGLSASLTQIAGLDGSFATGTIFGSTINNIINNGDYVQYTEKNASGQVVGSYLLNASEGIFITYDSREAVIAKYNYAASNPGVGLMCWSYTEDGNDNVIDAMTAARKGLN